MEATKENTSFLDNSLKTPEERNDYVKNLLANTPPEKLTPYYLEKLATYILSPKTLSERKNSEQIITFNRKKRMNMRETSFEGLVGKLENGEDGIYGMIANDKNIIFQPKTSITEDELNTIEPLKQLSDAIKEVEETWKTSSGNRRRLLKKQLIEMRQDQYVIRSAYKKPIYSMHLIRSLTKVDLIETIKIDEKGLPQSNGLISFFDPASISAILCNYSRIKEDSWEKLNEDSKWMIYDFENIADAALKDKYPILYDLMIYKIDGKTNAEIQSLLLDDYGVKHTVEYISSLWRNKIPKLIAEEASKQYLIWYYTYKEKGHWKKCNRCGQIKLGHNYFFSKNTSSKDGWYSICKECRNKRK